MRYRTLFPHDVFSELNRLQRALQQGDPASTSIRGSGRGGYPALNVGGTPQSIEVYAFLPGIDPAAIEVQLEKGVLTIAGERKIEYPAPDARHTLHIDERFAGRFRRVVTLPDDIDAESIAARYRDGVLHVSIKRRAEVQPRRITIQ